MAHQRMSECPLRPAVGIGLVGCQVGPRWVTADPQIITNRCAFLRISIGDTTSADFFSRWRHLLRWNAFQSADGVSIGNIRSESTLMRKLIADLGADCYTGRNPDQVKRRQIEPLWQ